MNPPVLTGVPLWLRRVLLSSGDWKLARFRMLNISARNCTLKVSESFRTAVFLISEKSRLAKPGPTSSLRPALPFRFMQVLGITAATLAAAGWHTAASDAGATAGTKQ